MKSINCHFTAFKLQSSCQLSGEKNIRQFALWIAVHLAVRIFAVQVVFLNIPEAMGKTRHVDNAARARLGFLSRKSQNHLIFLFILRLEEISR